MLRPVSVYFYCNSSERISESMYNTSRDNRKVYSVSKCGCAEYKFRALLAFVPSVKKK
jgi:hypothetical protein